MLPADQPLEVYRGDSATWQIRLWDDMAKTIPVDLTGATAAATIRQAGTTVRPPVVLECTIEANIITMTIAADAAVPARGHQGQWDLEVTFPDGRVQSILAGKVDILGDVTP